MSLVARRPAAPEPHTDRRAAEKHAMKLSGAVRVAMRGVVLASFVACLWQLGGSSGRAAEPAATATGEASPRLSAMPEAAGTDAPPPEQVRSLIELLENTEVREWLRGQLAEPPSQADGMATAPMEMGTMGLAERRLEAVRGQLRAMVAAIPRLRPALATAWATLERDLSETGILWALLLVGTFVGLGFGVQWLYWVLTGRALRHIVGLQMQCKAVVDRNCGTVVTGDFPLASERFSGISPVQTR